MDVSRLRDFRQTVEEAWTRLRLLQPAGAFSADQYNGCVQRSLER